MTPLDFIALTLAASAIVDVWFNGSIFATQRAAIEDSEGFWAELLSCPFCLLHHTPWILIVLFVIPGGAWMYPVYALAATRLAWLVNGVLPPSLRFDRESIIGN